ncbi:hypothetical protein GWI33_011042 [Rhynchophorus ferrugineus]|uniref:Uncharacterized protein n=1 Tax=Rhynchophorus ferrugineus TaxID=354439 RepID=A0A834IDC4_RHYFE|nr:hypothetical protein GWI33_011042 [Rhynchophorus ferrugineus]
MECVVSRQNIISTKGVTNNSSTPVEEKLLFKKFSVKRRFHDCEEITDISFENRSHTQEEHKVSAEPILKKRCKKKLPAYSVEKLSNKEKHISYSEKYSLYSYNQKFAPAGKPRTRRNVVYQLDMDELVDIINSLSFNTEMDGESD